MGSMWSCSWALKQKDAHTHAAYACQRWRTCVFCAEVLKGAHVGRKEAREASTHDFEGSTCWQKGSTCGKHKQPWKKQVLVKRKFSVGKLCRNKICCDKGCCRLGLIPEVFVQWVRPPTINAKNSIAPSTFATKVASILLQGLASR